MRNKVIILFLVVALTGCSKKDNLDEAAEKMAQDAREKVEQILPEEPPQNLEEALKKVGDALADGEQSVSAGELKELLPEELGDLKRVSHEAERAGFGIKVSKASASYGDGDQRMNLMITDLGGVSGLAKMGRELFETEVDKEDENGFERTTTYKGHDSFQRMQRSGDQSIGEIMIFVDDRFTVHLDAQNVPFEQMIEAADQVDLAALARISTATKQ